MANIRVTGYTAFMYFEDEPGQMIILVNEYTEIGNIMCADPALFNATIDILRNEGPNIFWDEDHRRIAVGLEPAGEGES